MRSFRHRSLQARVLAAFGLFAVLPLAALGLGGFAYARESVERSVAERLENLANVVAALVRDRYAIYESDVVLFSNNVESARLLEHSLTQTPGERRATERYLEEMWVSAQRRWLTLAFLDRRNRQVLQFGSGGGLESVGARAITLEREVVALDGEGGIGRVIAVGRPEPLVPDLSMHRLGASGSTFIVDRASGRIVHHGDRAVVGAPPESLFTGWERSPATLSRPSGTLRFDDVAGSILASYVSIDEPAWTVVAATPLEDFIAPYRRLGWLYVAVVVSVVVLASVAFTLLTRQAMRPLAALVRASDALGSGAFDIELPEDADGDVGALVTAFSAMRDRLRRLLRDIETKRRMAAIGEFAAQVAHEIRNPLTSIKLNLQGLRRAGRPAEPRAARRIDIALREIDRLDSVVAGVLTLGRPRLLEEQALCVHDMIGQAAELLSHQLARGGIEVACRLEATVDRVTGDAASLRSVFLNLLLNAAEAMPHGGRVDVITANYSTEGRLEIVVTVRDQGTGIADHVRDRIFEPFVTTKSAGTGFGLTVARRAVTEHGGRIAARAAARGGTELIVTLPTESDHA